MAFTVSTDTLGAMGGDVIGTVQATDNLGVDDRTTCGDPSDGVRQVLQASHPVLEQIPHARGPVADEVDRIPGGNGIWGSSA